MNLGASYSGKVPWDEIEMHKIVDGVGHIEDTGWEPNDVIFFNYRKCKRFKRDGGRVINMKI